MVRSVGAVLAGMVIWAVLWIGTNVVLAAGFPETIVAGEPITSLAMLLSLIGLSVVYSIGAGFVTALVAARREVAHALALGVVQLGLGIYFEVTSWALLPVWYHLTFLALLVPATVGGGWLHAMRSPGEE